ncbi:MAG: hypothetical protein HYV47_01710 [Candidatus Nealsonbacteria bacterium]|nr:hypothetical protein [Candidatus Nealsonbacteria bacterium]
MDKKTGKHHFHIRFEIEKVGIFERWAWYKNRDSFVKSLAIEFEKRLRRKIFIKVLTFEEIPHPA